MRGEPLPHGRSLRVRLMLLAIVVLSALAASFALWDPLDIDERVHIRRITRHAADGIRADLADEIRDRLLAQTLLARSWGGRPSFSAGDWEVDSSLFLEQNPDCFVAQWVDPTYDVRWVAARDGAPPERGLELAANGPMRALLEGASSHRSEDPIVSPMFRLPDGRPAAWVVVPVFRGGILAGFFVVGLDTRAALGGIVADHATLGYAVAVWEGTEELYRSPGDSRAQENAWAQDTVLGLPGVSWRVRVWPNPSLLAQMRSPLPELALVLGGLLGLLLVLAAHFARAARLRSQELSQARDEVELRVTERTTELRRANEGLQAEIAERRRTEGSLRSLSGRLLQVQDEERRRIARELHDSTAQTLGAVALSVDKARRLARGGDDGKLKGALRESAALLEGVSQEIRTLSFLLHPSMLDELGLEYVLPWYAEGFGKRSGIATEVEMPRDLERLPPEVELTLYRVVQEALANVHRHSGSRTARIALRRDSASVTLEITDQGRGIPPGVLEGTKGTITDLGVGIAGMRERLRQLGGRLEIVSDHGGTSIRIVLPLAASSTGPVGAAVVLPDVSDGAPPRTRLPEAPARSGTGASPSGRRRENGTP